MGFAEPIYCRLPFPVIIGTEDCDRTYIISNPKTHTHNNNKKSQQEQQQRTELVAKMENAGGRKGNSRCSYCPSLRTSLSEPIKRRYCSRERTTRKKLVAKLQQQQKRGGK